MIRQALLFSLSIALSGCAFRSSIQHIGMEYNEAVANLANEQTLLNILRAKERMPQHYTTIAGMKGSATIKGTSGLKADTKGSQITSAYNPSTGLYLPGSLINGVELITPNIGAEISTGPTFDIVVQDGQEFYSGMMKSIDDSIFNHLLRQGMSPKLMSLLLIESIEIDINGKSDKISKIEDLALQFTCFTAISKNNINQYIIPESKIGTTNLKDLTSFDNNTYRPVYKDNLNVELKGFTYKSITNEILFQYNEKNNNAKCQDKINDKINSYTLRSAEGVIYFIGEYLRMKDYANYDIKKMEIFSISGTNSDDLSELFHVTDKKPKSVALQTRILGKTYYVDSDIKQRGRTMQVIAIIQQLTNLYKKSNVMPTTVPVRVEPY